MSRHWITRRAAALLAVLLALGCAGAAAADTYNPLEGKILVAVGDSLTTGIGLEPDPVTGMAPAYPVLVAARNNMQVYNLAINGAWMASSRHNGEDVDGFSGYFADGGFLPEEIDYLTLNFGANDWSYGLVGLMDDYCIDEFGTIYYDSTPRQQAWAMAAEDWISLYIGTPNDMDIDTWWGAWNTVLTHLRTYYPHTKVGIIVPYPEQSVDTEFALRLRETLFIIAETYGYPTIDCGDAGQWFCVGYAQGLDPDIADRIAAEYTIDGVHPNALGHERMADSYEDWLRGI